MKKTTKKAAKKVATKKVVPKPTIDKLLERSAERNKHKVRGSAYWKKRKLNDKERDWGLSKDTQGKDWVADYSLSESHPHREKILQLLTEFQWTHLLEVGCNAGANLLRIREAFPDKALFGMDINPHAIAFAKETQRLSNVEIREGDIRETLPFQDGFHVILADAVLMYITPDEIDDVMDRLAQNASRAMLIVDRYSEKGGVVGGVWGRDYRTLLERRGYTVAEVDMSESDWGSSKNWVKHGKYFLGLKWSA